MKKLLFYSTFLVSLFFLINFSYAQKDVRGLNVPYFQTFDTGDDWSDWVIESVGGDASTWVRQASGGITGSVGCMRYAYSTTISADDWLFAPKLNLTAGVQYSVRFHTRGNSAARIEKIGCYVGNDQTIAAMTTLLWEELNINNAVYRFINLTFIPETTGEHVFGFWAHSDANQQYLFFDNFSVSEAGGVAGVVKDGDGNPVEGVTVQIDGTNPLFSTTTDVAGAYLFTGVHTGEYNFTTIKGGYHNGGATATIVANTVTTQDFVIIRKQPETVPYFMGFESGEDYIDWIVVNVNQDLQTWTRQTSGGFSQPSYMRCNTNIAADDWLFSPRINMETGNTYSISFYVQVSSASYNELLSCFVGNEIGVSNMTTEIWSGTLNNASGYKFVNISFTPTASGAYVFGFWAHSPGSQGAILFDDFHVRKARSISGIVTDGMNPITDAEININTGLLKLQPDLTGVYSIDLPAGDYNFKVTRPNHIDDAANVILTEDADVVQNFVLPKIPALNVPYTMGFEEIEDLGKWYIYDANNDGSSFVRSALYGNYAPNCISSGSANNGNDWLFSPKLSLEAGKTYTVQFYARTGYNNYTVQLYGYAGTDQMVNYMETLLLNEIITYNTATHKMYSFTYTAPTTREYVFGLNCITFASNSSYLYIDDFSVSERSTVSGIVTDGTNPVAGAIVSVDGTPLQVTTDETGAYSISLMVGLQTMRVRKFEYATASVNLTVISNTPVTQNFTLTPNGAVNIPYYMSFEPEEDHHHWLIINADGGNTWQRYSSYSVAITGFYAMQGNGNSNNDWLITPKMNLTAGENYTVSFYLRAGSTTYKPNLQFFAGTEQTIASLTDTIWIAQIDWATHQLRSFSFIPETTGEYVFGWRIITAMQAGLYMDNFAVTTAGSISGLVSDGTSPIAGARVELGGGATVLTDASGYYEFLNTNTGVRNIKVTQAGYHAISQDVTVTTGNMTTQNFTMTLRPTYNLPYFMSFEANETYDEWWAINAGSHDFRWKWSATKGNFGPGCLTIPGLQSGNPNTWSFTPKFNFTEGYAYSVKFYAKNSSSNWPIHLNCYLGNAISVEAMTTELWGEIIPAVYPVDWSERSFIFTAPTTGEYALGFWMHYPYNYPYDVYFDDFSLINLGIIQGVVTDGDNPMEGVTITVDETGDYAVTDVNGFYRINTLFAGEYNLTASLVGWDEAYETVTINAGATTTQNFILTPITITYSVSGTVIGSGIGSGLEGATVTFSGYGTYSATTDATGAYTVTGLYESHTYTVTVNLAGYETYITTLYVLTSITDYNITLNELINPVQRVTATLLNDDTQAEVTWTAPETFPNSTFRYCSNIALSSTGYSNGTRFGVLGSVFRANAEVTSITWVTAGSSGQHNFVNVFVFDLDENGNPTNRILYNMDNVPNVDNQWSTHTIPGGVSAPNGFMLAVSYNSGSVSLLYDQATDEYPFVPNVNFVSSNYETDAFQSWGGTTTLDLNNFMIFGAGFQFGKSVNFQHPTQEEPTRTLLGYALYRLQENQPQTSWIHLGDFTGNAYTDNDWNTLSPGVYQYAVKTQYSGNVWSIPKLSNKLAKDMEVNYTINITSNSGDPVTGAKVILKNNDGDLEHVYTGISGTTGITFNNVWLGTYHIEINLDGFEKYTGNNLIIDAPDLSYAAQLIEISYPVVSVFAEKVGENALISWLPHSDLKTFRYDNGVPAGQLGFSTSSGQYPRGVMGSCHRENATLYNMSWFLNSTDPNSTKVNIYILDLDEQGMPTSNILYSEQGVNSTKMEWNTYEFPTPVVAPNGFFVSLSHSTAYLSIGTTKPDEEYPFQPQTHFYCSDFNVYGFTAIENNSTPYNVNFMIRAQGSVNGKAVQFPKSLQNFVVYRLLQGQPETAWTKLSDEVTENSYTDTGWGSLVSGTYQYAVKAHYTGNTTSAAKLSNTLVQVSDFNFRVNVTSNGGISVVGATVTLTNQDGNPAHVYTATSDAMGATFNNVFKGIYDLKITLAAHQEFTANNLEINASGLSYNAILQYLGIEDYAIGNYILIPNPVQSLLTVKRPDATKVNITVYNSIGALIHSFDTSESEFVIDVTNLSAGIFFIRLSDGTQMATKSFVKQ